MRRDVGVNAWPDHINRPGAKKGWLTLQALITFDDTFDAETILEAFQDAVGVVKVEIVHEHCGKCARLDIKDGHAHPPTKQVRQAASGVVVA